MKLRTVTIWATGLISLLTLIVPIILSFVALRAVIIEAKFDLNTKFEHLGSIAMLFLMFWVCSGLPMVISYFIARKMKYLHSIVTILCSTIAYMIYYIYWLCQIFFVDGLMIFWVMFTGMVFAPIMIFIWVIAVILDYYHADLKTMTL